MMKITPINRPVQQWPHIAVTPERTEAYNRWLAEEKRLKTEFLRGWTPPPPPEDDEDGFKASAIENAAFECWRLAREGYVVAATAPFWTHAVGMWLDFDEEGKGILAKHEAAVSLTLPFLMQGGEFHVHYETEKYRDGDEITTHLASRKRIRALTDQGHWSGELIENHSSEMTVEIVKLPGGTPQHVADRIAGAYTAVGKLDLPSDYPAVLPPRNRCAHCHRPLKDPISKVLGLGPDCAALLGVPHNDAAVWRILTTRRTFMEQLA